MPGLRFWWFLGGFGSLVWLPLMCGVWLVQGKVAGAISGLLVAAAGAAYLVLAAPWRLPNTPIRTLCLGFVIILSLGAGVAFWQYWKDLTSGGPMPLVAIWTLFVPAFALGGKSWSDLHRQGQ